MHATNDLVIRGGTIADGSGGDLFEADIAINDGLITAVGKNLAGGTEEIDARGLLVTPGFVDIHTHYDGQATWDHRMQPSSWHGVTTVLMGNCGVGFAPCKPDDRERLVKLMEGVEDIPEPVMTHGLPWNWETFPQFLDALTARKFDVDIGVQIPHAPLRVFVMGERGAQRELANASDIEQMRTLVREAVDAGAFGVSTSRAYTHKTKAGEAIPTMDAGADELMALARGLKDAGRGVFQFVGNPLYPVLFDIMRETRLPLSVQVASNRAKPDMWLEWMDGVDAANAEGLPMWAQVCGRAVGILLGLDVTMSPFSLHPSYQAIAKLPLHERVQRLCDANFRVQLFAESAGEGEVFDRATLLDFDNMFAFSATPNYEPKAEESIGAIARQRGVDPAVVALDHMLTLNGHGLLYAPFANYRNYSLDDSRALLQRPHTLSSLSDGGAHLGMICDGSLPTFMLTHWTRDRTRGEKLPLTDVVRMQTSATAAWMGLQDRGRIAPGLRADINVIDYENLTLHAPQAVYDLPAGGRRLVQRASGYVATLVAGVPTYRDGVETGELPGRLLRSAR